MTLNEKEILKLIVEILGECSADPYNILDSRSKYTRLKEMAKDLDKDE